MKISKVAIERRVEALSMLTAGETQARAAQAVGVSERTVNRWLAEFRLGTALPQGPLSDALKMAFAEEHHRRARAAIFVALARMAEAEALLLAEKLRRQARLESKIGDREPVSSGTLMARITGHDATRARDIAERALNIVRSASR